MKRSLSILLAVLLLVLAAGCGKNASEPTSKPAPKTDSSSTTTTTTDNNTAAAPAATTGGGATAVGGTAPTGQSLTAKGCDKVDVHDLKQGDTAKLCALEVTLKDVNVISKGPPQGYIYFVAQFSIKNNGDGDYTINPMDHFKLENPEGKTSAFNVQATTQRTPRLQGTLGKGQTISGWVGYMPKQMSGTYKVTFIHPDLGEATWNVTR